MRSRPTDSKKNAKSDESVRSSDTLSTANARTGKVSTAGVVVQKKTSSHDHASRGPSQDSDSDVVPDKIDLWNERSVHRSRLNAYHDGLDEDDANVPESVRKVVSSTGHSLDTAVQRTMESRMGEDFSDVQVHTGPRAAKAAEDINAKAFTVGNHVAFNRGEYDPSSQEGQHVLAHELAHVRQQTGGAVSMLPQDDVDLEIDPDPELEREAEETAQRVMQGEQVGIQRLAETEVHVQRTNTPAIEMPRRSRSSSDLDADLHPSNLLAPSTHPPVTGSPGTGLPTTSGVGSAPHDVYAPLEHAMQPWLEGHVHDDISQSSGPSYPNLATSSSSSSSSGPAYPDLDYLHPDIPYTWKDYWKEINWNRIVGDAASGVSTAWATLNATSLSSDDAEVFYPEDNKAGALAGTGVVGGLLGAILLNGANCPYCLSRNNTFLNGGAMGKVTGTGIGEGLSWGDVRDDLTYALSEWGGYAGAYAVNQAASWDERKSLTSNLTESECLECKNRYNIAKAALNPWYQKECRRKYLNAKEKAKRHNDNRTEFPELSKSRADTPEMRNRQHRTELATSALGNLSTGGLTALGLADFTNLRQGQKASGIRSTAGKISAALGPMFSGELLVNSIACDECGHVNRDQLYESTLGSTIGAGVSQADKVKQGMGSPNVRPLATAGAAGLPALLHIARQVRQMYKKKDSDEWRNHFPYKCTCQKCSNSWNAVERYFNVIGAWKNFTNRQWTLTAPGVRRETGGHPVEDVETGTISANNQRGRLRRSNSF